LLAVDTVSTSVSMALDCVQGVSMRDLMAAVICLTAVAIVVLSESISVLSDSSSVAYPAVWGVVVVGID